MCKISGVSNSMLARVPVGYCTKMDARNKMSTTNGIFVKPWSPL